MGALPRKFSSFSLQIKKDKRDDLARHLRENGIYTTYRYFPLHRVKAFNTADEFPNANYAANHTLCLPIHQAVTDDEIEYIVGKIKEFGKSI